MDPGLFPLTTVADRFEVALRRYQLFSRDIPTKFQNWLKSTPSQRLVFASLDSICTELFPDLLSIDSVDFPQRWMLPVACVALKHHVSCMDSIELSECGKALRVLGTQHHHPPAPNEPVPLRNSLAMAAVCAAGRAAALEVKVAELECRCRGLLPPSSETIRACKKRKPTDGESVERTFVYLNECRAEALDALAALRTTRRKNKRQAEKLQAAHNEISRLKEELWKKEQKSPQPATPTGGIPPKRAMSLAGYWNLLPNDLLSATPLLIQAVEKLGGTVLRREGMQPCFSQSAVLVDAVVDTMTMHFPQYARRIE